MPAPIYTTDTSAEAQAIHIECFRAMLPHERLRKACAMSRRAKLMALAAIRRRHPTLAPSEVQMKYLEIAYGPRLAADVRRWRLERKA